ncbi:MAG: F0F1 ATP synthase subunit epsilon [Phycisphaerales bacterium]
MPDPIRCTVITPEARVLDGQATYVSVPLWDGKAGFERQTAPLVAKLGTGELRVDMADGSTKRWFVDGGFVQNVDNTLKILARDAQTADSLDEAEIKAELAEANARKDMDAQTMERITHERQRAQAKLSMLRSN